MRSPIILFTGLFAILSQAVARSATGDRVLVVLDPSIKQEDYSQLWSSLKDRGYEITFKSSQDDSAQLVKFSERQYDHLIVYAPSTKSFAKSLNAQAILEAQSKEINTLFLLGTNLSEYNRDLLREFDLEFVPTGQKYMDAWNHIHGSSPAAALLTNEQLAIAGPIFPYASGETPGSAVNDLTVIAGYGPIVYPEGTVHATGLNPYLVDILHGSKTGYVGGDKPAEEAEKKGKEAVLAGKRAALVSAMQTRDNTRIGFVGSGEMFSDKYWQAAVETSSVGGPVVGTQSQNGAFATDFTKWLFQETGVVKVVKTHHHRGGETTPREMYRKKDDLTYTIELSQHVTTANGTSFSAPFHAGDIQLEFTMLDPHYRIPLIGDAELSTPHSTTYKAQFTAPDRHGVFKFVVEYFRPGWSYIRTSDTASVVPLRHDEHPRFITGAWPFYASTISTSAAFLLFCTLWLALGEDDKKGKKKAE